MIATSQLHPLNKIRSTIDMALKRTIEIDQIIPFH